MKTSVKFVIVGVLAMAVVAAVALKRTNTKAESGAGTSLPASAQALPAVGAQGSSAAAPPTQPTTAKLPKLIDLGADKCIPCKMMAPLLEELKREYAGRLEVEFIDVWKNPSAGQRYGIQMIPTQIFYDAEGRERARHVGFIGKEDILAKFKQLGVNLEGATGSDKLVN